MSFNDIRDGERALELGAYHQAFEIFLALAKDGEDPAYYKICEMVLNDQIHPEQIDLFWFELGKAIREDNAHATYNAGVLYSRGLGAAQNLTLGAELFEKACQSKIPEAFVALAKLYIYNFGAFPSVVPTTILQLLESGIQLGSAEAASILADLYISGRFVERDVHAAFLYLYVATKLGSEDAKRSILLLQTANKNLSFEYECKKAEDMLYKISNPRLPD